jgi:hypothetical protein
MILIDLVAITHQRSGITNQLPANQPRIAAMQRIGEHTFEGMGAKYPEERRLLDRPEPLILFGRSLRGEVFA